MTYSDFLKRITEDKNYLNEPSLAYNRYHARRFYKTYKTCAQNLKRGDKVLSIGAGGAPIEKILAEDIGVEITVVDFPDLINYFEPYYNFLGFKMLGADLTKNDIIWPEAYFDMLLASEVIEHIPKSPYQQLSTFHNSIKKNGKIIITTPNLGSILHIGRLLMMKTINPDPDKFFSEVGFDNQEVHRREYMPSELITDFGKLSYKHLLTQFFYYTYPEGIGHKIVYLIGDLIPRFRSGMLLVCEKN